MMDDKTEGKKRVQLCRMMMNGMSSQQREEQEQRHGGWKGQGAFEWFKVVAGMGSWGLGWEERPEIFKKQDEEGSQCKVKEPELSR